MHLLNTPQNDVATRSVTTPIEAEELSYQEVVDLAYNNNPPSGPNMIITVTYSRGENGKEGSMLPGDAVKVKNKMVFDVSATDRS